jgi:hypothetical protein
MVARQHDEHTTCVIVTPDQIFSSHFSSRQMNFLIRLQSGATWSTTLYGHRGQQQKGSGMCRISHLLYGCPKSISSPKSSRVIQVLVICNVKKKRFYNSRKKFVLNFLLKKRESSFQLTWGAQIVFQKHTE